MSSCAVRSVHSGPTGARTANNALVDDARDRAPIRTFAHVSAHYTIPPTLYRTKREVRTDIPRRLPTHTSISPARTGPDSPQLTRQLCPNRLAHSHGCSYVYTPRQHITSRAGEEERGGERGEGEGRTSPHSQREKMSGGFPELLESSVIASAMRLYSVMPRVSMGRLSEGEGGRGRRERGTYCRRCLRGRSRRTGLCVIQRDEHEQRGDWGGDADGDGDADAPAQLSNLYRERSEGNAPQRRRMFAYFR